MMKTLLKLMILPLLSGCCALTAMAQHVTVVSQTRLSDGIEGEACYPRLSPDATKLLFSDVDTRGLRMLDLNSHTVTTLSEEPGAGFDARWAGNDRVCFVTARRADDHLIYRTPMSYDLATHSAQAMLEPQHGAVSAVVGNRGTAFLGAQKSRGRVKDTGTSVYTKGSQLIITRDGVTTAHSPVESYAGYLWASLSPNGDKVAFVAAESGVIVTDLNGNVLASLGHYEMPAWLDNDYLVVQNATDDGHQFTSSQILLLKADGTFSHALTVPSSMTMQPTAAAGTVVYSTIDGKLTMLKIQITQ